MDPGNILKTKEPFTNFEVKEFDFESYLNYPVYEPLRDEAFCCKARVVNGTVAWNNEIDFDLDTLYLESNVLENENVLISIR